MATNWKDLNKKQKRHLREMKIHTLTAFKRNHAAQEKMREESDHNPVVEPCWDCKGIARDLGLMEESDGAAS